MLDNFYKLCVYLNLDYIYKLIENEESTEVHGTDILNSFSISTNGNITRNTTTEDDFAETLVTDYLYKAITSLSRFKGIKLTQAKKILRPVIISLQ